MFRYSSLLSLTAICLFATVGCRHLDNHFGAIPPPPDISKSDLKACFDQETRINGLPDAQRQGERNKVINEYISAVRESHDVYNGRVSQHRSNFDTGADAASLATAALSAVNPGVEVGAASTAIIGMKASVDKNYWNDVSRVALLLDLYKNADTNEAVLKQHLRDSYEIYRMSDGCRDLDAFFRSGSAIRAVSAAGVTPINPPTTIPPVTAPAPASPVSAPAPASPVTAPAAPTAHHSTPS